MITGKCLKCHGKINHHENLVYVKCVECGVREKAQITCQEGHYYCNACASKKVLNRLYEVFPTLDGQNPSDISEKLFIECGISGNSPHPLTTAAFLVAYKNLTQKITDEDVLEGISKSTQIPGGWCGYYGNCGSAVGLGVAFAIINKSTPMHDKERSIANLVTAEGLKVVAHQGGPRCCTGSVRGVLEVGIKLAKEYLGVEFPQKNIDLKRCWQSKHNHDCKKKRCAYYGDKEAI
ncbi:MAG: DUF5714 domain-containing protein [Clostridia bacterium]|nr:DUF5714 domain-containing protein [Clostridia bacterium]